MKVGKVILAALAATIFNALYGMVTCGWLFTWVYKLEPVIVWKPVEAMTGNFWALFHGVEFVLFLILALVFVLVAKALPAKCRCCSGSLFGLIVWAVGVLPGMFALYMFTVINPGVLLYWAIMGLVNLQITGIIIALICGEKIEGAKCFCS